VRALFPLFPVTPFSVPGEKLNGIKAVPAVPGKNREG
jgi:hypothetical protein